MPQRNSQHHVTQSYRPPTIPDALRLRGQLIASLLVLVLLITNGGAG
jgi:hypothetical protein